MNDLSFLVRIRICFIFDTLNLHLLYVAICRRKSGQLLYNECTLFYMQNIYSSIIEVKYSCYQKNKFLRFQKSEQRFSEHPRKLSIISLQCYCMDYFYFLNRNLIT